MRYPLSIEVTDRRRGWKLGRRVAPRAMTIRVSRYQRHSPDGLTRVDLSDAEVAALFDVTSASTAKNWERISIRKWVELEVVSSPSERPRCVVLRAPNGISAREQRFPLAGIVTEAVATIASQDGSFVDYAKDIEYEDVVFEVSRGRKRRRTRQPVTDERLERVAELARQRPTKPTNAVEHGLDVSRGYALRLIKQAAAAGLDVGGAEARWSS